MPIYITVVASLLFLSFAYYAVGQAVANRNDAQGAADASALAAAHEAREQIGEDLLESINDSEEWDDLLEALLFPSGPSCDQAKIFAVKNNASSEMCERIALPRKGFRVDVKTTEPVGSSVIPGTESTHSTASAVAVIEPLCALKDPPGEDEEIVLVCRGEDLVVVPGDPDPLPDLGDLFKIRLVE